jgi:adenosylcobinamide-phosphate synthase
MQNLASYFSTLHSHIMDPDRIPLAITAIVLAAILGVITGPVAGNANPLLWFFYDKILGGFGERLDRVHRSTADLALRGFAITAIGLALGLLIGKFYAALVFEKPVSGITEIILLSTLITSGSVWYALLRLYFALEKKQALQGAYLAISRSTRVNLSATDDFGITRAGMGFAARSFDKGLVAPVFWYLIGGLPLAVIYTALAALGWRFGKDGFSKGFGAVPLALEKLLGYVPSLLAATLMTLATIVTPTAAIHKGLAAWFGHKNRAPYEQGGYPLSALAWSLNVSLGGASQDLSGSAIHGIWVGPDGATAKNDHKHLRRAIYINFAATILFMASLCGAYLWSGL